MTANTIVTVALNHALESIDLLNKQIGILIISEGAFVKSLKWLDNKTIIFKTDVPEHKEVKYWNDLFTEKFNELDLTFQIKIIKAKKPLKVIKH